MIDLPQPLRSLLIFQRLKERKEIITDFFGVGRSGVKDHSDD
jgi:hypothetical protein